MDIALDGIVAFSSGRNGHIDIWTFNLATGQIEQVTTAVNCNNKPCFSPDGNWIVFTSNRTGRQQIFKTSTDGKGVACQLTDGSSWSDSPRFSPDGSKIAYVSNEAGGMDIWVMDSNGQNPKQITDHGGSDTFVGWSPDGQGVTWSSDRGEHADIWLYDFMRDERICLNDDDGCDQHPAISPCGTLVAFVSNRHGFSSKNNQTFNRDLWMMSIDGSNPVQITQNQACEDYVCWSPCGTQLMYSSDQDRSRQHVRILNVANLVDAYASADATVITEIAIHHCDQSLLYLESDLTGDTNTTYLGRWLPEKWHDSHYPNEYFGLEKFPHWIAVNNSSMKSSTLNGGQLIG